MWFRNLPLHLEQELLIRTHVEFVSSVCWLLCHFVQISGKWGWTDIRSWCPLCVVSKLTLASRARIVKPYPCRVRIECVLAPLSFCQIRISWVGSSRIWSSISKGWGVVYSAIAIKHACDSWCRLTSPLFLVSLAPGVGTPL